MPVRWDRPQQGAPSPTGRPFAIPPPALYDTPKEPPFQMERIAVRRMIPWSDRPKRCGFGNPAGLMRVVPNGRMVGAQGISSLITMMDTTPMNSRLIQTLPIRSE
jgi:hypothetical protein